MSEYVVATYYKFVDFKNYEEAREKLINFCSYNNILGTILIANEGINSTISGKKQDIINYFEFLKTPFFNGIFDDLKYSLSEHNAQPFKKLKVKRKNEIVTTGWGKNLDVVNKAGEHLPPEEWIELINRDDVELIDTRNDFEVELGSFNNSINPRTESFRDFKDWFKKWSKDKEKDQKIAMFCTGGIRCEKSTAMVKSLGYENVYHLKGGIINYLNETNNESKSWHGECFIFDERVALDDNLKSTNSILCEICYDPIKEDLQGSGDGKDIKGNYICKECND